VCGLDSTGLGQGPVAGCCECGDEPSGSCATELVSCVFAVDKTALKEQNTASLKPCALWYNYWGL
jgi:hypothetical protein